MIPPPRRKGYLSTQVVEMRAQLRRFIPRQAPGILTSVTTNGVIRRPITKRVKATTGGGPARWS